MKQTTTQINFKAMTASSQFCNTKFHENAPENKDGKKNKQLRAFHVSQ